MGSAPGNWGQFTLKGGFMYKIRLQGRDGFPWSIRSNSITHGAKELFRAYFSKQLSLEEMVETLKEIDVEIGDGTWVWKDSNGPWTDPSDAVHGTWEKLC
jgi:hypothetical protein